MSRVSIIVPCYNEEKYIANCIESIVNAEIDYNETEVILVDGESNDLTVKIIHQYMEKYSFIKLVSNPKRFTPISMNIGIEAAQGEFIFIISAHAQYKVDYFKKLVYFCQELDADCVGGVLQTDVKNKNKKSNAIKTVLMHKFGVGNASFRTGSDKILSVDTVAFGCYTKKTFERYGLFDTQLIRNQDIELNKRIVNGGGKIYLIPEVQATYYARETFIDLAKNNYGNGYWNILTTFYTKAFSSLSLRHFIPLLFVLSLIVPLLISLIIPEILWISFLSLGSYLALVIMISLNLVKEAVSFGYTVVSFLTLHLSYGIGSFIGILKVAQKILKGKS